MNNVFKKDLYRYYGNNGEPLLKKDIQTFGSKIYICFQKSKYV